MPATGTTQINADYLNGLKGQLQTVLNNVNNQLTGVGTSTNSVPVDQNLKVLAGASTFNAGTALNTALQKMGGSIHDQLTWLQKVLNDMINEITTTVNSFNGTESLNTETVDSLITDFQNTINDMNSPPSGSGTNPPPSGNTNPQPSNTNPQPGNTKTS